MSCAKSERKEHFIHGDRLRWIRLWISIGATILTPIGIHFTTMISGMNKEPIHSLLTGFELAQLANLCCEEAEEAKALIPRYSNDHN